MTWLSRNLILGFIFCVVGFVHIFGQEIKLNGTIRADWDYLTDEGMQHFQITNARLIMSGNTSPLISYLMQVDICNKGEFKFLNAIIDFNLNKDFKLSIGQMRLPFTHEGYCSPHQMLFVDKSYINSEIWGNRGVGIKAKYSPKDNHLFFEAGLFNSSTLTDHGVWHKELTYAAKAGQSIGNLSLEASTESYFADSIRYNSVDLDAIWHKDRWHIECEGIYLHYTKQRQGSLRHSWAYSTVIDYKMPLKLSNFRHLSFQGRYDAMAKASTGKHDANGVLIATRPEAKRVTIGTTLRYLYDTMFCDFRINYEICMYKRHENITNIDKSKIVAEILLRF